MKREILFRGKTERGRWAEGCLIQADNFCCIFENEDRCHPLDYPYLDGELGVIDGMVTPVIPETVGQFTGLYDKNGKKIFEGDVCRFREWSNGDMCWVGKVHYENQQFVISGDRNKECESPFLLVMSRFISENIEIIGNIYDNPELLGTDGGDKQ